MTKSALALLSAFMALPAFAQDCTPRESFPGMTHEYVVGDAVTFCWAPATGNPERYSVRIEKVTDDGDPISYYESSADARHSTGCLPDTGIRWRFWAGAVKGDETKWGVPSDPFACYSRDPDLTGDGIVGGPDQGALVRAWGGRRAP